MKLKRLVFLAAIFGAVAAVVNNKQKQLPEATDDGIWKPVDPLSE